MKPKSKPTDSERDSLLNSLGFGEIEDFDDECLLEEEIIDEEDDSDSEVCNDDKGCVEFPSEESTTAAASLFSESPKVEIVEEPTDQSEPELEEEENLTVTSLFSNEADSTEEAATVEVPLENSVSVENQETVAEKPEAIEEQVTTLFEPVNQSIEEPAETLEDIQKPESEAISNLFQSNNPETSTDDTEASDLNLFEKQLSQDDKVNLFETDNPTTTLLSETDSKDDLFEPEQEESLHNEDRVLDQDLKSVEEIKEQQNSSFIEIGKDDDLKKNLFGDLEPEPTDSHHSDSKANTVDDIKESLFGDDDIDSADAVENLEDFIIEDSETDTNVVEATTSNLFEPVEEPAVEPEDNQTETIEGEDLAVGAAAASVTAAAASIATTKTEVEEATTDEEVENELIEEIEDEAAPVEDEVVEEEDDDELDLNCPGCNEILTLSKAFVGVEGQCVFCDIAIVAQQYEDGSIAIVRPSDLEAPKIEDPSKKNEEFNDESEVEETLVEDVSVEVLDKPKTPSGKIETENSLIDCESELIETKPASGTVFDKPENKEPLFFESIDKVNESNSQPKNETVLEDEKRVPENLGNFSLPAKKVPSKAEKDTLLNRASSDNEVFPQVEKSSDEELAAQTKEKTASSKLIIPILIIAGTITGAAIAAFLVPLDRPENPQLESPIKN